ncbi:RHS repeat-associated core domain-containing protein [Cyanobacterium aponinum UTEX 3222]|uniref:RHS repeat-associated core domain-containing protein n=1 Tax=Cyanobacterium aponinum TaxID=379064 RepID=UPI00308D2462|nr:RHS repeat-associated core domain-containing protein [Cyanobacterium aponinum UTEX 3222]
MLVAVTDFDSSGNVLQVVELSYDMFGQRLSKVVDGVATYFVYDRDDVILDFVDDGNGVELDMRYLHGNQVDEVLAQEDGNGDVVWLLTDHLGTIRDLLDNTGDVVNHLTYDSYGNVVSETDATVDSRYRFTGREWDEEIDLYYYRARYYSGQTGRFISVDPIFFDSGTYNLYGYVDNNPINSIDPSGNAIALPWLYYGAIALATATIGYYASQTFQQSSINLNCQSNSTTKNNWPKRCKLFSETPQAPLNQTLCVYRCKGPNGRIEPWNVPARIPLGQKCKEYTDWIDKGAGKDGFDIIR